LTLALRGEERDANRPLKEANAQHDGEYTQLSLEHNQVGMVEVDII